MAETAQRKVFAVNDRVKVSASGGWKQSSLGVICDGPEPVETQKGSEYFYWVEFDEPQEDVTGPDLYRKAQILSCYLEPVSNSSFDSDAQARRST